jgi:hypothetical protein
MAKSKASGKTYTSQGVYKTVSRKILNGMKRDRDPTIKMINIQKAYLEGRNPWITITNPNKEQTNRKQIRVRANDIYGLPKERDSKMFIMQ